MSRIPRTIEANSPFLPSSLKSALRVRTSQSRGATHLDVLKIDMVLMKDFCIKYVDLYGFLIAAIAVLHIQWRTVDCKSCTDREDMTTDYRRLPVIGQRRITSANRNRDISL